MLQEIENANDAEQAEYGEKDLEEMGGAGTADVNGEQLKQKIDELNQRLREKVQRLEKYKEQTRILAGRTSLLKDRSGC